MNVKKETQAPTLEGFKDRSIERAKANRQKASTVYAKECILRGDAGLRAGEVIGLELPDVSRANQRITIERQVWRDVVGTPKGGWVASSR